MSNDTDAILTSLDALHAKVDKLLAAKPATPPARKGGDIADDTDLDGKYGDEEIRRDPSAKYWPGESNAGRRMSECSAEYLDAYAKYKDSCAYANEKEGKEEKAKYVGYDRKSAARARGWAKRIREGFKPKTDSLTTDDDSGIPF